MNRQNVLTRAKKKQALALTQARRLEEAQALYAQVCEIDKQDVNAWFMLGAVQGMLGRYTEAADCFRRVIEIQPQNPQAHYNLGIALRDQGKFAEAIEVFRATLRIKPDYADAQDSLAHALLALERFDEAITAFEALLRFYPTKPELHSNLGSAYQAKGLLLKAEACYRQALRLNPGMGIVHENLGSVLSVQGKHEEALACFREELCRNPSNVHAHSNLLLTLNYLPDRDPLEVLEEHRVWGRAHGCNSASTTAFANSCESRRLKIGYVSQDFRTHSVAYYLEPLLRAHDRSQVEVYCYANVPHTDDMTQRLRSLANGWRDIVAMSDEQVTAQIRSDGIDVLVDLAGHTGGNRLRVFACRPAPVQVTYLGYPNTTGLSMMDYRVTDFLTDPEGQENFYTEKLQRLLGCFLCYQPPADAPEVTPLPARKTGRITFGSFNNLAKINSQTIQLWSKVLHAVRESRLLIKNHSLTDPAVRERYWEMFREQGVASDRIEFLGYMPSNVGHLALYGDVDIALDTFPYNGTTTTCEALWMGVPVITLKGSTHAGRVGLSLLTTVGLRELVVENDGEYIARAAALAADLDSLAARRAALRERMRASPLCDAVGFTRDMEAAFREMWRRWCAAGQPNPAGGT
jgi:predicted O-linked N-acetylglucosamine transferase (SPINDLY family)